MTLYPFNSEEHLNPDWLRDNFLVSRFVQIYTGTGFDTTQTGSGSDSDDYEMIAIAAADLGNADYVEIEITGTAYAHSYAGNSNVQLKVQTKYIGGSYADSTGYQTILKTDITGDDVAIYNIYTWKWIHTLSANEKANGVQVKLFSISTANTGGHASFTNIQTIIKLGAAMS